MSGHVLTFVLIYLIGTAVVIVAELLAVFNKTPGDTISENLRLLFRIKVSKAGRAIFALVFLGFNGWLFFHLLFPGLM